MCGNNIAVAHSHTSIRGTLSQSVCCLVPHLHTQTVKRESVRRQGALYGTHNARQRTASTLAWSVLQCHRYSCGSPSLTTHQYKSKPAMHTHTDTARHSETHRRSEHICHPPHAHNNRGNLFLKPIIIIASLRCFHHRRRRASNGQNYIFQLTKAIWAQRSASLLCSEEEFLFFRCCCLIRY